MAENGQTHTFYAINVYFSVKKPHLFIDLSIIIRFFVSQMRNN